MDYRVRKLKSANGQVRQQPRAAVLRWLPGAFMLLFLAGGLLLTLLNPATFEAPKGETVLNGDWAAAYQAAFEEALALHGLAVTTWGVLDYLLFREGRPGVLVGQGGWLFTTEEFEAYPDAATATRHNLDYVLAVRDQLAAQSIDLVVAAIPAKANVYEERLGRYRLPDYARARYTELRQALLTSNVVAPDVLEVLQEAKAQAPVFLRTGTHWTPFGAQVVAEALARELRARVPFEGLDDTAFETRQLGSTKYRGDLLAFLPLGVFENRVGPPPDVLERYETTLQEVGSDLFGEVHVPVALVGTSYSANDLWHFQGALQQALGAEVLNVAEEGQGPFAPMARYLASEAFRNAPPELVIWEIPARYLPAAFEQAEALNP